MNAHDSLNFEIRLSGPRDRFADRLLVVFALVALLLGVVVTVSPGRARRPAATTALAAETVEFGSTTADVYAQCKAWRALPARERLRGARHMLISLRHAAGDLDAGDYSAPADEDAQRLVLDLAAECAGLGDGDADDIVGQLAHDAYETDMALHA